MSLHSDHIAGAAFVVAGASIWAVSGDLPFGTLASPGAGMMPKLLVALMVAFGLVLTLRAGTSPPMTALGWDDLPHATRVILVTAIGVAVYERLGFLITMSLLLFTLIFGVERKPILKAALFSASVTGIAYFLFDTLLKSPLPRGLVGL